MPQPHVIESGVVGNWEALLRLWQLVLVMLRDIRKDGRLPDI
jgi:hypothetical protein